MRESCPHCAYPHPPALKPPSCLACGRRLEGAPGPPVVGRAAELRWALARVEAHMQARAVGCVSLSGPSGAGLSTLLQRLRLALLDEAARLDQSAPYPLPLTLTLHPFLSGASRAPSPLCALYRKALEALLGVDLAQDPPSQERWARRVLDAWEAPPNAREAFERLWGGGGGAAEDSEGPPDESLWGELSWGGGGGDAVGEGVTLKNLSRAQLIEEALKPAPRSERPGARDGAFVGAEDLARLLLHRARRTPIVVLCYDLQGALEADVRALAHLIELLRAEGPEGRHALCFVLERPPEALTPASVNRREPPAFTFEETAQLIRAWHPDLNEPLAAVERLQQISKGNPRALISAVLAATRDGAFEPRALTLTPEAEGAPRAPLSLEDLLALVAVAGPTCCLEQLRVLSRALDPTPWSHITLSERPLEEQFARAASDPRLLTPTQNERFVGRASYRFSRPEQQERHERLWRARYAEPERAGARRALAEWMSAQRISQEAEVQVLLSVAEHWLAAGEGARAGEVTARAAHLCARRGNLPLARSAAQRAFDLLTPQGPWAALRDLYPLSARLWADSGAPHQAEALLQQGLKRAWQLDDLAAAHALATQLCALYEARGFAQQAAWVGEWLSRLPGGAEQDGALPGALAEARLARGALRALKPPSAPPALAAPPPLPPTHPRAARRALAMHDPRDLEPPPLPVLRVLRTLKEAGREAWVVGGSVRDRLLGRSVGDWDLTTSATPEEVSACFERVIATGIEHGTVTVLSEGLSVEVTTYRVDGAYADGRRPEAVTFTRSLREDLARRDFTINAMAWDPDEGRLEDPFGGVADLERGLVRAVGDPLARFREDGLRALRAVRFAAVLAFELDAETEAGITRALDVFRRVSMERVQVELFKTVLSDEAAWGVGALRRLELMSDCAAELTRLDEGDWARALRALERAPRQLEPRLAALFHALPDAEEASREALGRLRCARRLVAGVAHLLRWRAVSPSTPRTDGQVRALAAQVQLEALPQLLGYRRAWAAAEGDEGEAAAWDALGERMRALRVHEAPQAPKDLALRGGDLAAALDLPASRLVGDLLSALLQHVWERPEDNTPEALLALAPRLLSQLRGR